MELWNANRPITRSPDQQRTSTNHSVPEQMYNEPFHVPQPDEVIFKETWAKGEKFRSGMVWNIGKAKSFISGPDTRPTLYKQPEMIQILQMPAFGWADKPFICCASVKNTPVNSGIARTYLIHGYTRTLHRVIPVMCAVTLQHALGHTL